MKKSKTPPLLRIVQWWFPKLESIAPFLARRFFIKIFFTPLNYAVPEKEVEARSKASTFSVQVKGRKVQCYSWGEGPPVLLVHGWAGRATQFRKFIEPLNRAGYRVVGFDGPAHGLSEGTSTEILEFEEAIRKIYGLIGVPEAIIAHSFGGSAVLYAAMNGLQVKKLINIASPTIGDEIINTYLKTIGGSWKTGNYFKGYIQKRSGKSFDEFTALHFIRNIPEDIDLLLVHDHGDEEVSIDHAHQLKKLYPRAKIHETNGLGHTRILKDEDVIRHCVTFIRDLRLS